MEEEQPGIVEEVEEGTQVTERVEQFIDIEGEKIRQETERIQSPIIAKARKEYTRRLKAFLEEERKKIKEEAENEAAAIKSKAESEANDVIVRAQAEKLKIIDDGKAEVQTQAEQIIEESKRQANMERKEEVAKGRKEADAIIEEAKQSAEKLVSEANELARKTVEAESAKILAEARAKASSEAAAVVSNSWRRAQQMLDSAEMAYSIVRKQLQDCLKVVTEADRKMSLVNTMHPEDKPKQNEPEPVDIQSVV